MIDETERLRFIRRKDSVGEEELVRGRTGEQLAPPRRAAEAGHDPELRSRMREARAPRGVTEVERKDQIERAAETVAVDHGHRDAGKFLDHGEHRLAELGEVVGFERSEA